MSFFSTPNSNKRIKRFGPKRRQSLLEVNAHAGRKFRLISFKKLGALTKIALCLGIVLGSVFGGKTLVNRLIWENPAYALDDIRVTTDGLLTRAQVLEIIDIQDGRNIFKVDISEARKALDLLPQVEKVDIRKVFPSRMDIRISERQPIAWVAPSADTELGVTGKAFLVDTRGYVMRTRKLLPEHFGLPILTGIVMEDVAPGQRLPTQEALVAVDLIKLSVDDTRWQPKVVDVSKGYCLLVTDQRNAKITFGFDNIEGQFARLRQIMDYVEPTRREFQSVNLMLERSVPVVFAPAPPAAPGPADSKNSKGGKGGKAAIGGGLSGGVALSPSSAFPQNDIQASPAAARPQTPPVAKADKPEPPSPLRLANVSTTTSSKVEDAGEPGQANASKTKTRTAEKDSDSEKNGGAVKKGVKQIAPPPKAEKVEKTERAEKPSRHERGETYSEKAKSTTISSPSPKPENKPEKSRGTEPSSLPPSEMLRRLFNPHG